MRENLQNNIINENVLHSEVSFMHYKGCSSNYLFQLFLKLKRSTRLKKSYFSNVQPCKITCTLDVFIK